MNLVKKECLVNQPNQIIRTAIDLNKIQFKPIELLYVLNHWLTDYDSKPSEPLVNFSLKLTGFWFPVTELQCTSFTHTSQIEWADWTIVFDGHHYSIGRLISNRSQGASSKSASSVNGRRAHGRERSLTKLRRFLQTLWLCGFYEFKIRV